MPAVFIILASYSGCNRLEAVGLFIASMAFMGGFYSSVKINAMDIAPNYAGTCSAFVNGIAAISGIITPYLIGLLTPDVSMLFVNIFVTCLYTSRCVFIYMKQFFYPSGCP